MYKVLYVDDNQSNLDIFVEQFSSCFKITVLDSSQKIFQYLESENFDIVLLDIHMPEKNGFDILNELSESSFSHIPVIFYTTDELQMLRYQALQTSACDVIYRSHTPKEIELRIINKIKLFAKKSAEEKFFSISMLQVNLETSEAFYKHENLNLTPIEFRILVCLMKAYPEKIARESMIKKAWSIDNVNDRTVNTHLTNLRNKLPREEFTIESPRGAGVVLRKLA
jgi:DNA-binding response OmpR family regulator